MGFLFSKPEPPKEFDEPWRNVDWNSGKRLKEDLEKFKPNIPELQCIRILLHGPVGAGKSCFINSVYSAITGEIKDKANEESSGGKSCTKTYKAYTIPVNCTQNLPIILTDVMGLEDKEEDGIHPDDIINALDGHIRDGYRFNPTAPLRENNRDFVKNPCINNKVHCLVSVVSANSISAMTNGVIQKMVSVRKKAQEQGIPVLVLMTKVDEVCPLVKKDLTNIYKSKKIKEKMEECSLSLGPSVKYVLPVCNYFEERETNHEKDVLILMALKAITSFTNDKLEELQFNPHVSDFLGDL